MIHVKGQKACIRADRTAGKTDGEENAKKQDEQRKANFFDQNQFFAQKNASDIVDRKHHGICAAQTCR